MEREVKLKLLDKPRYYEYVPNMEHLEGGQTKGVFL